MNNHRSTTAIEGPAPEKFATRARRRIRLGAGATLIGAGLMAGGLLAGPLAGSASAGMAGFPGIPDFELPELPPITIPKPPVLPPWLIDGPVFPPITIPPWLSRTIALISPNSSI